MSTPSLDPLAIIGNGDLGDGVGSRNVTDDRGVCHVVADDLGARSASGTVVAHDRGEACVSIGESSMDIVGDVLRSNRTARIHLVSIQHIDGCIDMTRHPSQTW